MKNKLISLLQRRLTPADLLTAAALAGMAAYALVLAHGAALPAKAQVFRPGASYFDWHGFHTIYNPRSGFWRALAVLAYLASVAVIGYKACFSGLVTQEQRRRYGLLLAPLAFIPGYFISVAVNRLVTLALPNAAAMPALDLFYACALGYGIYAAARRDRRPGAAGAAAALLLYAFFLVDGLQKGNSHVVGDGAVFFLDLISKGDIFAAAGRFPLFSQHYDEIAFLYPLYPLLKNPDYMNIYLPFLLLYAAGKAAALLALTLALRAVSGSLVFAGLMTAFMFFGSPYPVPGSQLLVFDSGSPLNHVLHIGRVFGVLAPLLLAAGLRARAPFPPPAPRLYAGLFLAALGLSASTPSNFYAVLAALAACLLLAAKASGSPLSGDRRAALAALAAGMLAAAAAPLLIAGPLPVFRHAGAAALLLGMAAFAAAAAAAPVDQPPEEGQLRLAGTAALVLAAGYGAGMVLLGNLLIPRTLGALGHFEMLSRAIQNPLAGSALDIYGPNGSCDRFPLQHCAAAGSYIGAFGLMYAALLLGAAASGRRLLEKGRAALEDLLAPAAASFTLAGVFLYEYTNGLMKGDQQYWLIWFKSRLLEPWFYMGMALSLGYAYSVSGRGLRRLLAACLAGAMAFEFIYNYGTGTAPQFFVNLRTAGRVLYFF